jgi:1-deoxy-D-xylulose-5-phosphate reductoisomerase
MKKIAILGSTGSIGTQALDIIAHNPDHYRAVVLSGFSNMALLSEQIKYFKPEAAVVPDDATAHLLKRVHPGTEMLIGAEGLIQAASYADSELVLNALVGMLGLAPTYAAIKAGNDVALANKETLVAGGDLIMKAVRESGVRMIPVDSEHSAIWQCLSGYEENTIRKLILTASGGPFRGKTLTELAQVTVSEALKHPNWKMGRKISIDSATLMNKGLEVIEAHWLFDVECHQIEVVVHPESIIHSMVEFNDHAIIAQMGTADMRGPINYAFSYPNRQENRLESLNFGDIGQLTFEVPDLSTFRCLQYAYDALNHGGSYMIALNAANEELVQLFLADRISFLSIQQGIQEILEQHVSRDAYDLETILAVDSETREKVKQRCF